MSGEIFSKQRKGSRLETPALSVFVNDSDILTGVIDFEVTNASHFTSDTFRISAAIANLPRGLGIDYWGDTAGDVVDISVGFKDSTGHAQPKSLIYGQVDDVDVDMDNQTMTLTGRDLSARFLDNQTAELFQDQTASRVAQTLAARRGLKAQVVATTEKIGSYYERLNAGVTKSQSEWDFLIRLAEHEQFDVWVSGKTLFFQPPVPENSDPFVLHWSVDKNGNPTGNFEDLKMHRSLTLAKDVIVNVLSFNQAEGKTVKATAKRGRANTSQRAGGQAQVYTFRVPNLNRQQADKLAAAKADEITKHERVITGSMPGDTLLTTRVPIKLTGTGTKWDQVYQVDTITGHGGFEEGYSMEFRAKNHSVASTI